MLLPSSRVLPCGCPTQHYSTLPPLKRRLVIPHRSLLYPFSCSLSPCLGCTLLEEEAKTDKHSKHARRCPDGEGELFKGDTPIPILSKAIQVLLSLEMLTQHQNSPRWFSRATEQLHVFPHLPPLPQVLCLSSQ